MISVCIATYNGEKYIKEQLNSILCQLDAEDEVVVSDSGSTDRTLAIIESLNDPRIKILHYTNNGNTRYKFSKITANFNNALQHAKGDVIFISDQDDVWIDGKVEKTLKALANCDLVSTDCVIVDAKLNIISDSYFSNIRPSLGLWRNLYKNSYLGCCMAFKKTVLQRALPIPQTVPHDIWIGLIAEHFGSVCFLMEPLVLYRRHGGNASPATNKSHNTLFFKISYRLSILRKLFWHYLKKRKKKKSK